MNMMTAIRAASTTMILDQGHQWAAPVMPEIVGPDLTKAEPIDEVIARLAHQRNGYSTDFLAACTASGMDATVFRDRDGVDALMIGMPEDDQRDLRFERYNALAAQLKRGKFRRQQVIDHLNHIGRFADNQPFVSAEEAATAWLEAGGRIIVHPNGQCEHVMAPDTCADQAEHWSGFPLRRLAQRIQITLYKRGARDALAAYVREHGKLHEERGCFVLKGEGQADG